MPLFLAASLASAPARAACVSPPDPEIGALREQVERTPQAGLDRVRAVLRTARGSASPDRIAWLRTIEAEAYNNLTLGKDVRATALAGTTDLPDMRNPAHVELLTLYAAHSNRPEEMAEATSRLERAAAVQTPGSSGAICIQAALGRLLTLSDKPELATVRLMHAYQATARPGMDEERNFVLDYLVSVTRYAKDYRQALLFSREKLAWNVVKGRTFPIAVNHFTIASLLNELGRYDQAVVEYRAARQLSGPINAPGVNAYIDMATCDALTSAGRLAEAEPLCRSAERTFAKLKSSPQALAQFHLARIAQARGSPASALALLDRMGGSGGIDQKVVNLPAGAYYDLRAAVLAALGREGNAYADLRRSIDEYKRRNAADLLKQAAALQARFDADRQISRNRELRRRLESIGEQERAQRQRITLLTTAAAIVIALLSFIIVAVTRHRRELQRIASSDGLTGLLNRRSTVERATAALGEARERAGTTAVALLDLDHFKEINDHYGHAAGDEVLRCFAETMRDVMRVSDIVGRWGGEEFLLVLPETAPDAAIELVERVRRRAREVQLALGDDVRIRFSAGVATGLAGQALDEVVARADMALYAAKESGRDVTCLDDPAGVPLVLEAGVAGIGSARRATRPAIAAPVGSC